MADDDGNDFVERTIGDWTAYQDDGRVYYHNEKTGESVWEPPPGFEDDDADVQQTTDEHVVDGEAGAAAADSGGGDYFGAQTPPMDGDDGFAKSPTTAADDDGFTKSPTVEDDDGFTKSPTFDNDGFTKSPTAEDDDGITKSPTYEAGPTQDQEQEEEVVDGQDMGNGWVAYKDDDGRVYYYNADSGETQWERPDAGGAAGGATDAAAARSPVMGDGDDNAYAPPEETGAEAARTPDSSPLQKSPMDEQRGMDTTTETAIPTSPTTHPPEEKTEENTAEKAEEFLQQPDAVMEPTVSDHIATLVQELGPQEGGRKALQSLMNGYSGDTAVCGLMGLWLAELKSMGGGINGSAGGPPAARNSSAPNGKNGNAGFQQGADAARDVAEEVVNRLAKERFTKDGGDAMIKLSKKEAAFIDKMIKSERWRKLLIDLSATNKDSKLFMYCLQSISNLGHHRAIANRINQSDYFGVFNSMLQSELSIAGKIAVDGFTKEVLDSIDTTKGPMGSLIADLRRTCTSTSYTYLYAMEVLAELLAKSHKTLADRTSNHPESLTRAIRKWERLREELEDEMLKPLKTGTTFQRKRRIDVCLTMSDLFQRKRRRPDPTTGGSGNGLDNTNLGNASNGDLANTLDSALSQLLTKNSLGIQIDKEITDNMLKFAYGGSTDRIGDLLIKHPTAIIAILNNLFGSKRIRLLETRLKCARLIALAVTASERMVRRSIDDPAKIAESDESELSQVILKASQSCEQLENHVSFTVLDSVENTEGSVGRELSAMCIQHSAVAQGVLIWAKELASGPDFVTTASYPTISPCILSLARLICRYHPLTRPNVLEVALIFMGHSNREISHRKMQSIKEQCLRLMLWLATQGHSLVVLSAVQNKLEKGGSEMDSALVRFFFTGILEIIQPPFSLALVRALGTLMMKRPCIDALQSKHFETSKQGLIVKLINQFDATGDFQKAGEEDKSLLSMLKSTYCSLKN